MLVRLPGALDLEEGLFMCAGPKNSFLVLSRGCISSKAYN